MPRTKTYTYAKGTVTKHYVDVTCKTCNKPMRKDAAKLDAWQGDCQECSRDKLRRRSIRSA